jgi:SAM-dependent methyltransferase
MVAPARVRQPAFVSSVRIEIDIDNANAPGDLAPNEMGPNKAESPSHHAGIAHDQKTYSEKTYQSHTTAGERIGTELLHKVCCCPMGDQLPLPPVELRELTGNVDERWWDNPEGNLVFPWLPKYACQDVLDFGCGCGRIARQLIQQDPQPRSYLGIDLHKGMIAWCRRNLSPHAPQFRFEHHDVFNIGFNPDGQRLSREFPAAEKSVSLVVAWSVFTHLREKQVVSYLGECSRVLKPDGHMVSTWFLFDKRHFPMMQAFQNALYINDVDPSNAVIVDAEWLWRTAAEAGLTPVSVEPPAIRGFHWLIVFRPSQPGLEAAARPMDEAEFGSAPPPIGGPDAHLLGLDPKTLSRRS